MDLERLDTMGFCCSENELNNQFLAGQADGKLLMKEQILALLDEMFESHAVYRRGFLSWHQSSKRKGAKICRH